MVMTATRHETKPSNSWAELNGRWFFAWRMAAACEGALQEVSVAMTRHLPPDRTQALERVNQLLHYELRRWVRRGEALDMIVDHLPRQTD